MFEMKNGVLYKNDEPIIGIGLSYYASYHPKKVPVANPEDRIAQMEKDLEAIARTGFNTIRMAALGDVKKVDGKVEVAFAFIDEMLKKAEQVDIGCFVRLQGYNMILGDYPDGIMLDQNNQPMPFHWGWFVRNCVNHPQVLEDNRAGTGASAKHFSDFQSVVGYQIYNEPAYPVEIFENDVEDIPYGQRFFDYNPHTIRRYREWLKEKSTGQQGIDFDTIEPPRKRPTNAKEVAEWMQWRLFHMERLNEFLCEVGGFAKEVDAKNEVFTCMMTCPFRPDNAIRGEDYYTVAQGMDFVGITHYVSFEYKTFYNATMSLDCADSAAQLFGKKAWMIECDGRTAMSVRVWERETYAILGCGHKGIHYYQWRADFPFDASPEPQRYGVIWADGKPTDKFDGVVRMNGLLNQYSSRLAIGNKVRSGVAVLYSNNTMAYQDAKTGDAQQYIDAMENIYKALRQRQIVVDFVRAQDLADNALQTTVLLIASLDGLDEAEKTAIERFAHSGNSVAIHDENSSASEIFVKAWTEYNQTADESIAIDEFLKKSNIQAIVHIDEGYKGVDIRVFDGNGETILIITNSNETDFDASLSIQISHAAPKAVEFVDTAGQESLAWSVVGDRISFDIPRLHAGAFVFITK